MKHGKNGWIVPAGDSSAVAKLFLDIYEGRVKVHRDLSRKRELRGKYDDPNTVAESWVGSYHSPVIRVHDDRHSTSEDFWTVGNATRWMLLASRLLGLPLEDGKNGFKTSEEEKSLLKGMRVGQPLPAKGVDGENVWNMVMGDDALPGEGALI